MKIVIIEHQRPVSPEHYNDVANAPLSASLNSGYALAVSRGAGWETSFLDFSASQADQESLVDAIRAEHADIILFHWVYCWGHEGTVSRIMELLRCEGCGPVGAFGLFPTLSRSRLFSFAAGLDFIIAGEFEKTLEELLNCFEKTGSLSACQGLVLKNGEYAPRKLTEELSWLPIPDDVGAGCSWPTLNIAASRGCFGSCGFCFINRYYGCSKRRERSVASLEAEIEIRLRRRAVDQLYFVDPTFIGIGRGQKDRVAAISRIAKAACIPFGFETRVDTIDRELVSIVAQNGAASIFLGIESGCDSVLKRINKRITPQQIEHAVRCIQESGIRLTIGFIMFEPDATIGELSENYDFLERLGLLSDHELTANLLYHSQIMLYGSAAWERLENEGRLIHDEMLPFEAGYRFRDGNVARVCRTMRRMATVYFQGMDGIRQGTAGKIDGTAVNGIMKESFLSCLRYAECSSEQEYERREELLLEGLCTQLNSVR